MSPVNSLESHGNTSAPNHQLIAAVRPVNQSELPAVDRKLVYRRNPETGPSIVQVVNHGAGEVTDQMPLPVLLRIKAEFDWKSAIKPSQEHVSYLA